MYEALGWFLLIWLHNDLSTGYSLHPHPYTYFFPDVSHCDLPASQIYEVSYVVYSTIYIHERYCFLKLN